MAAFNELTISDHCGLFIDVKKDAIMKDKIIEETSPFLQKLQSNSPKVIRHYKKILKKQIEKGNIEQRAKEIHIIATIRTLTPTEEKELNTIDDEITEILLKAEKNIKGEQHNLPWSLM